jgi:hypothetical protein
MASALTRLDSRTAERSTSAPTRNGDVLFPDQHALKNGYRGPTLHENPRVICRASQRRSAGPERWRVTSAVDRDADIRARLQQHWKASERGDVEAEHSIYAVDALLDYPQSGEPIPAHDR